MAVTIKENWKDAEHLELLQNAVEFLSDIGFLTEDFATQCLEEISKEHQFIA